LDGLFNSALLMGANSKAQILGYDRPAVLGQLDPGSDVRDALDAHEYIHGSLSSAVILKAAREQHSRAAGL
jgi:hypothetical protein